MPYIINELTNAIKPEKNKTCIFEGNHTYYYKNSPFEIVDRACCYNGSSLVGRQKGTSYLLGSHYKPPIIISEKEKLILIPTHSVRNVACAWVMLNNIVSYKPLTANSVQVEFKNGKKVNLNINYSKFDKQVLRATRLESIINGRNNKKHL